MTNDKGDLREEAIEELLGDLMDECSWYYDASADGDPATGPKHPNDGYNVADYFTADTRERFATREEGLSRLRKSYKGSDCFGVGLKIPEL